MALDVATSREVARIKGGCCGVSYGRHGHLQMSLHEARLIIVSKSCQCDWLDCSRNGSWRKVVARRHSRDVNGVDPNASYERDAGRHGNARSVARRSGICHRACKIRQALASSPSFSEVHPALSHTRLTRH